MKQPRNLVQACRLAVTSPVAAGRYYISDGPVYTTRQVVEAMAHALGVEPRFTRLPTWSAKAAYRTDMMAARLGLYVQALHLLGEADWNVGVSSERALRELNYSPTVTLEDGMRRAVDWCKATGQLDG